MWTGFERTRRLSGRFKGNHTDMTTSSNTQIVILASNGSTGILQDLGIRPEVLAYLGEFGRTAGEEIHGDGDFFNSLAYYVRKTGQPGLLDKITRQKRRYDFRFLNGIILKSFLAKLGYPVKLINNLEYEMDTLADCLADKPLAVLVSTTFLPTRQSVERTTRAVRNLCPDTFIIAGGPQIYYSYKVFKEYRNPVNREVLDRTFFFRDTDFKTQSPGSPDLFIIDKQGLRTLEPVLSALKKGKSLDAVPNLAFYDSTGTLNMTKRRPEAYQAFDHKPDWVGLEDEYIGPRMSVQGSVGCPYHCKFCNFHLFFDQFRTKTIETVRAELNQLRKREGVKHIRFTDDNLFFNPKSVEAFCNMMIEEDFPFTWSAMMRADSITPKGAGLLQKAGVTELLFGMESGDATVLKNMNKRINPERYLTAIKLLNENGISTESNLFFGFPGETEASAERTARMLENIGNAGSTVNWFSPFVFIIFPFTPVDMERDRFGLTGLFTEWAHPTMKSERAFKIFADILYKIDNLTISDRYISCDYEILPRSEVRTYSKHRAKLNNVMYRLKNNGMDDPELIRERDQEIRDINRVFDRYLKQMA